MRWFAITPGRGDEGAILARLPLLAAAGVQQVLVREKDLPDTARRRLAGRVAGACRELGLGCWVSEDWECARSLGIGVHLSERSPSPREVRRHAPGVPLGLSLHADSTRAPDDVGACQHVFLSPVFPVTKAPRRPPLGAAGFQAWAGSLPVQAFALGGIGEPEALALVRAGVRNLAAIRLFFAVPELPEVLARIHGSAP